MKLVEEKDTTTKEEKTWLEHNKKIIIFSKIIFSLAGIGLVHFSHSLSWFLVGLDAYSIGLFLIMLFLAIGPMRILRPDVAKLQSSRSRKIWEVSGRAFFFIIAVVLFYFLTVPALQDTSSVIMRGTTMDMLPQTVGVATFTTGGTGDSRYLYQSVYLNGERKHPLRIMFRGEPFHEGNAYVITYLPHSKVIVRFYRILD